MAETLIIDPAKSAFLTMDFQNDIGAPGGLLAPDDQAALDRFAKAAEVAAQAMDAARAVGLRILHVAHGGSQEKLNARPHMPLSRHIGGIGALREGEWGFDFMTQVRPARDEPVYVKASISPLASTDLNADLQRWGVDTLILTGLVTHFVVEGTARDAVDRGYRVLLLSDAMSSGGPERHDSSLALMTMLCTVTDSQAFIKALPS